MTSNYDDPNGKSWWKKAKEGFSDFGKDVKRGFIRSTEVVTGEDKTILFFANGDWKFTKEEPLRISVIRKSRLGVREDYIAYYTKRNEGFYRLTIESLNKRDMGKKVESDVVDPMSVLKIRMRYWDRFSNGDKDIREPLFRFQNEGILVEGDQQMTDRATKKYNELMNTSEARRAERDGRLHIGQELEQQKEDLFPLMHH